MKRVLISVAIVIVIFSLAINAIGHRNITKGIRPVRAQQRKSTKRKHTTQAQKTKTNCDLSGELGNKVKQIIIDELHVDENRATPNARLIEDLRADELDTVELIMRVEEEFSIEIPDEDAEKLKYVCDVYKYVKAHIKQNQK